MDISYATIPMVGWNKRLCSEKRSTYVVSSQDKPNFHAIYDVDTDLGSSIFFNDDIPYDPEVTAPIEVKEEENFSNRQKALKRKHKEEGIWTIYFDGYVAKVCASAGVYIIFPIRDFKALSYKLNFECTNNVAEYEYLLLGFNALNDMG